MSSKLFFQFMFQIAVLIFTGSAGAGAITLDFEGHAAGTIIDDEYTNTLGVTVKGVNTRRGYDNAAMIFDTADPSGGDSDLGTPNENYNDGPGIGVGGASGPYANTEALGNVLIISEDLDPADPDDEGRRPAGHLQFSFSEVMHGGSLLLLDVEVAESRHQTNGQMDPAWGSIQFLLNNLLLNQTIFIEGTGNNGVRRYGYSGFEYDTVRMNLGGSGAVAEVVAYAPEPPALALLGLGLAWIGYRQRNSYSG